MAEFTLPHHHSDESDALSIKETLDKTGNFTKVAEIFKNLGDSNRLRIFCLLCHREECVIDIAAMV
ncbi:MAG: ArsR family transcriptional regulator, partial [Clostridia bacterium]|nr:ArsR family transcriptional regulator [Clostridia bacterium]